MLRHSMSLATEYVKGVMSCDRVLWHDGNVEST